MKASKTACDVLKGQCVKFDFIYHFYMGKCWKYFPQVHSFKKGVYPQYSKINFVFLSWEWGPHDCSLNFKCTVWQASLAALNNFFTGPLTHGCLCMIIIIVMYLSYSIETSPTASTPRCQSPSYQCLTASSPPSCPHVPPRWECLWQRGGGRSRWGWLWANRQSTVCLSVPECLPDGDLSPVGDGGRLLCRAALGHHPGHPGGAAGAGTAHSAHVEGMHSHAQMSQRAQCESYLHFNSTDGSIGCLNCWPCATPARHTNINTTQLP